MSVAYKIELPDELAEAVEALSKRARKTGSVFVREVLERYLQELEDAIDGAEAEAILNDPNTEWIPLEQVKAELGL